jgi:hypothetical protein
MCFSAKHAALKRKSKDWLSRNQSTRQFLFPKAIQWFFSIVTMFQSLVMCKFCIWYRQYKCLKRWFTCIISLCPSQSKTEISVGFWRYLEIVHLSEKWFVFLWFVIFSTIITEILIFCQYNNRRLMTPDCWLCRKK